MPWCSTARANASPPAPSLRSRAVARGPRGYGRRSASPMLGLGMPTKLERGGRKRSPPLPRPTVARARKRVPGPAPMWRPADSASWRCARAPELTAGHRLGSHRASFKVIGQANFPMVAVSTSSVRSTSVCCAHTSNSLSYSTRRTVRLWAAGSSLKASSGAPCAAQAAASSFSPRGPRRSFGGSLCRRVLDPSRARLAQSFKVWRQRQRQCPPLDAASSGARLAPSLARDWI
mmetsp:Transcript_82308/g.176246  ORF Transcript_82308/g.176246 Transcript_82308/m.176246 type:complete len:233 (+) Transcript_82308:123-821(+)